MVAQNLSDIEKILIPQVLRRGAFYMNFAYNVTYIFVPFRHPQQLMIQFCPNSDRKLAKLN
jgi:hypothetical protein